MAYRFGDGTQFPLGENYVQTLVLASDVCAELFRADLRAAKRRTSADTARALAGQELEQLGTLESLVEGVLSPIVGGTVRPRASTEAAKKILGDARQTLAETRTHIEKNRQRAVKKAMGDELATLLWSVLEPLLLKRVLPGTRWSVSWNASPKGPGFAELTAYLPEGLTAVYECDTSDGPWSAALPLRERAPNLILPFPARRGRLRPTALGRHVVTEVVCTPGRELFRMQRRGRGLKAGVVVAMARGARTTPLLWPVAKDGHRTGDEVLLAGDSLEHVGALWDRIRADFGHLVRARTKLLRVTFENAAVSELEHPSHLARALLRIVGPLAREMVARSSRPGELMLVHEDQNGETRELVLSRSLIERRVADLPPAFRRHFYAAGLERKAPRAEDTLVGTTPANDSRWARRERMPTERIATHAVDDIHITEVDDSGTHAA